MSLPYLPALVKRREDNLKELLLILLGLYSSGIVDRDRYLELGENLTRSAATDVVGYVNEDANRNKLPLAEPVAIVMLLQRVRGDLEQQITDLDAGVLLEEIKTRLQQSAAYVPWAAYSESVKFIAGKVGGKLRWITALDEFVCMECAVRHGIVYEPQELPGIPPLHVNCRCWVEIVI